MGAVVVEAEIFFAETFAAVAVSVGEDVAALEVFGLRIWHEVYPPGYFAGKVRTDKDLSMKLNWRGVGVCSGFRRQLFLLYPHTSLFHVCQ